MSCEITSNSMVTLTRVDTSGVIIEISFCLTDPETRNLILDNFITIDKEPASKELTNNSDKVPATAYLSENVYDQLSDSTLLEIPKSFYEPKVD